MTSTNLSPKQLNFAQISIVCVDILRQCLIDILDFHIKPTDLSKEIHLSQSLKGGKDKLNSEQRDLCCFSSLGVPDYNKFDVTLLYRLIRNLCPTLKPSKDWGKEPKTTDLKIGDDIERIRLFRNKHYAHAESAKIPDSEFKDLWNEGKSLIHRIQIYTTAKGRTTDYGLKLTNISGRMIKYEEYTSYVNLFRAISIEKNVEVTCGDTAHFKADIRLEESAFLSLSWEKVDGSARKHIDISCEKYKGSTGRQLNIHSVCKEDEGGYHAVISKNIDHKIFSNIGFLKTLGELPLLDKLKVSTTKEEICIHYSHTVLGNSPRINDIKWTKNKTPLDLTNNKYCGGNLDDSFLKITCPTQEDRGEYSCTVSNAVGSVSRVVILDEPSAKISTNTQPVVHGLETTFSCLISSCSSPEQIEWQKSCDENIFYRIDIRELKYHGSNEDPSSPVLCLPKTTFDDQQFYRIVVRNKIGEYTSDTHFLEVTGNRPNISNATCTTKDRSVRLNCDVYLYDKSPALQDVYWTKNEQRLDIQGSGGKYSGASPDDPSLTINNVNEHDAGNYQLTAINSVGPTKSDDIVLGVPDVVLERTYKNEDGSHCFMVTIKSNPAPFFVKWSMKDKESETLQQINVNADEYKGTSTSFPHPMLVVKNPETLENYCFQIEAKNVIGFTDKVIPDETNPVIRISDDNTVENLNRIYERGSRNIMFGKVFDELAEKFPEAKIGRLKDLIQNSSEVEDVTSLKQANSARDCFRILKSENIFTPEDVIFVQYLLKMTECEELETKCKEYAKRQNARYYYEKPPDNGYKNVHFHVVANIGCYRTENITKVRETVAAIVGCTIEEVLVNGYLHSTSFILVLSIKNNFVHKLLALKRKDKDTLSKLSIDYFKIDSTIIRLKGLRGNSMPPGEGDVKNLLEIPRNEIHSEEGLEIERQREVRLLQERINKGGRPLNVALIGPSGSGKSSFCNSIIAAFSVGGWKKRATTGHYGGHGEQVTHHLLSFPKIEYLDFDALYDYNYPTLIDMNGFEDSCDTLTQELLRIVFFGRLSNEERLMDAVKSYNSKGLDGLKEKYSQSNEYLKVDRIIFIASADNFPLPTRLMEAVRNTARKENRVIPIFGVLTHKDKISRDDSDYMRLEQEFREGLGIPENRFLLCTTYCDAYDKHHGKSRLDQRHPAIDIPILKFMQLVCDPAPRVILDKLTYTGEEPPKGLNTNTPKKLSPEPKPQPISTLLDNQRLGRMWVKVAIFAVIFFLLLPLISYEKEIQRICARDGTGVSSYCGDQSMVGKMVASFAFAAFIVVLDVAFDRYNQFF